MGVQVAADVLARSPGRAARRRSAASTSPRSSRSVGGIQGRPSRSYTSSSVRDTISSPVSASNRPYSESFSPWRTAISRIRMLCALEPVKYCSAAPHDSGRHHPQVDLQPAAWCGSTSSSSPLRDDLGDERQPGERLHERAGVVGRDQDVDVADGLAHAAQRPGVRARARSRSPRTARPRSPRPPPSPRRSGPARPTAAAARCRGGCSPRSSAPKPFRPRSRPAWIASASSSTEAMPSSSYSDHGLLRPEAGMAISSRTPAGIFARSSSTAAIFPVSRYSTTFSAIDLPTPGSCAAPRVQRGDVRGVAADRPGGLLVGPRLERVAAGDRDEVGVLLKERLDLFVRPAHPSFHSRTAAGPAAGEWFRIAGVVECRGPPRCLLTL